MGMARPRVAACAAVLAALAAACAQPAPEPEVPPVVIEVAAWRVQARGRLPARLGDDRRPAFPESWRADRGQRRGPRHRAAARRTRHVRHVRPRGPGSAVRARAGGCRGPQGRARHHAGGAEGRRQRSRRRADVWHRQDGRARQWRSPLTARLGSQRSAGARLQGVHLVSDSGRLPRDGAVHRRPGPTHSAGDEHVWGPRYVHHRGRGRVHARWAHAAPAAVYHPARAVLLRVQGRIERRGNLRRGALPLRRPARRRERRPGFQPGLQSALRVQPLHDLPDTVAREPATAEGAGG